MNRNKQMVRFNCPVCDESLRTEAAKPGWEYRCKRCSTWVEIPSPLQAASPEDYPVVTPVPQEQVNVPLKINLPKNMGGIETKISASTAKDVALIGAGGFMVALGVVVCAILGIRPPRA